MPADNSTETVHCRWADQQ